MAPKNCLLEMCLLERKLRGVNTCTYSLEVQSRERQQAALSCSPVSEVALQSRERKAAQCPQQGHILFFTKVLGSLQLHGAGAGVGHNIILAPQSPQPTSEQMEQSLLEAWLGRA